MKILPDEELAKFCYDPETIYVNDLESLNEKYENLKKEYEFVVSKHNEDIEILKQLNKKIEKCDSDNKILKELIVCFSKLLNE